MLRELPVGGEKPIMVARIVVEPTKTDEEKKRLERFQNLHSPYFNGDASEDAQDFLDRCHHMLRSLVLVESNRVDFTNFQLREPLGAGGTLMSWVG